MSSLDNSKLEVQYTTAKQSHRVVMLHTDTGDAHYLCRHIAVAVTHTQNTVLYVPTCLCFLMPPCQGLAQDILSDLVEDACLGLCFEVHRAVKQGYFFLDDTDQESMRDFGEHKGGLVLQQLLSQGRERLSLI